MRGHDIEGGIPESLRLFSICQRMKWAHLPVPGGIYDQHPQLFAEWAIIFHAQDEEEKRERERQDAKNRRPKGK